MRVLHCSDLHANDRWFRWLIGESRHSDLVCLSGDILDLNAYRSTEGQLERVMVHLQAIEAPLAICSGNHDSVAGEDTRFQHAQWLQELRRENLWVDGDSFELNGVRFRCLAWQGSLPKAAQDEVWIIHSPPDRTPTGIARGGAGFGDSMFGELCRAGMGPRIAVSGHVHEPQAWWAKVGRTWCLNPLGPENNGSERPSHIVIDLEAGVAVLNRASGVTDSLKVW